MSRPLASLSSLLVAPAAMLALAVPASASSDGAWDEFRTEVEAACLAAAEGTLEAPAIVVDPFGSQSYGLAVMTGAEKGGSATRSVICAFDKQTGEAEVGGALDLAEAAPPAGEGTDPGRGDPDAFAGLAEPDREALAGLPSRITRTLDSLEGLPESGADGEIVAVARAIAGGEANGPALAAPEPGRSGEARCTLRWFGFLENSVETVGTHRCRVGASTDGTMVVEKLTGEGMRVEIRPLTERYGAFVGRSFLPEQAERDYDPDRPANESNDNFGNIVGLATEADGRIHLVGGAERGMSPPDDSFFSVLTIDRP